MPEWIFFKAGMNKTQNKSGRAVELIMKGLMAEKEEELKDLNTQSKTHAENPGPL
jgi:hypothetical protein